MDNGETENRLFWYVENYSYAFNGESVFSPLFTTRGLRNTAWNLGMHPNTGRHYEFSFFLLRSCDEGPESFLLKFELSFFSVDGSSLYSVENEHRFRKGESYLLASFMKNLYSLKDARGDIFCVRCRMWTGQGSFRNVWQSTARTRVEIETIRFLHKEPNFSSLRLNEKKTVSIPSNSIQGNVYSSTLCIQQIHPGIESITICSSHLPCIMKISFEYGNVIFEFDDRFSDKKIHEVKDELYKIFTRQSILNNRKPSTLCINDELSLVCECVFRTQRFQSITKELLHEIPMEENNPRYFNPLGKNETFSSDNTKPTTNPITNSYQMTAYKVQLKKEYNASEKLYNCASALEDLEALYIEGHLTDVVLKTATKSFPVHKIVLCARSSVFRAMLSNDMREKNTDCIQVDDLSDETLQQLLLFLYSDYVEELQWESAMKLYYAGDKYAIEKLKVLCASFLTENVSASSASDLLVLADTHSDSDLKEFVEDFILDHEKEVFTSEGWEKLGETHPQLTLKTMQLKYKREQGAIPKTRP